MPNGVWREVGGAPQKRCPTCEARGREPWQGLDEYGRDAARGSGLCIRCKVCMKEDNHANWATMKERSPGAYAAARERADRYNAEHPEQARSRTQAYRDRKSAAGWRRTASGWVRRKEEDDV